MRKQPAFLKYVSDMAPMRRHIDAVCGVEQLRAVQRDQAAVRREQTRNHIDDCGLAGARRSEQSGDAAGRLKAYRELKRSELLLHLDGQHGHLP